MSKNKNKNKTSNKQQKQAKEPKQKLSKLKIASIIILAIIVTVCIAIDIWYLWIAFFAKEKITSTTMEVSFQTSTDGSKEPAIELKYFSNVNKNGYECFDVKYNFQLDEKKSHLYSQGVQYIAKSLNTANSLNWLFYKDPSTLDKKSYKSTSANWGTTRTDYYHGFGTFEIDSNFNKKEYQSIDNFETTTNTTNPIDTSNGFKWEIGEDIYEVKFRKNNDYHDEKVSAEKKEKFLKETEQFTETAKIDYYVFASHGYFNTYHCIYDVNYLNKILYESLEPIKAGDRQTVTYQLPDIFDYYKYNADSKQYSEQRETDSTKITNEINNFYTIQVTVLNDGLQKASDSLFKTANGNSTLNLTKDFDTTDYFVGKSIIKATMRNFKLVKNDEETYNIVLNEEFLNRYNNFKNTILLYLDLDYTELEKQGLHVNEPTAESLFGFKVYKLDINKTYY